MMNSGQLEEEDEEDYYAEDKFVYEDIAQDGDASSDDPEHQFLKQHAERTARQSEEVSIENKLDH